MPKTHLTSGVSPDTTTDTRTKAQKALDIDTINKMSIRDEFKGSMAVSVIKNKVIINFVSTNGQAQKAELIDPTPLEFANVLVDMTTKAHDDFRESLTGMDSLLFHALVSESIRTPLGRNLSNGSKDKKAALFIKELIESDIKAKADRIVSLEAELTALKG